MAQKINQKQYGKKYSTTEQLTGDVWIDGKPIYRKVVDVGVLPNNAQKSVPHGITGIDTVVSLTGIANTSGFAIGLPYGNPSLSSAVSLYLDGANIGIGTGTNRTNYAGYATIEYTKT